MQGAIFPPELEWLKKAIIDYDVDLLIECGRQDGISARWYYENIPNIEIFSIDYDDRPKILQNSIKNLKGTSVKSITGDAFVEVPKIIRSNPKKRIGIVEDAIKGWPGFSLLMSCIFYENVVLISQHNNHIGHNTRERWLDLSNGNAFLESHIDPSISRSLEKWVHDHSTLLGAIDRDTDYSSLALIGITPIVRVKLIDHILSHKEHYKHWDPIKLRSAHTNDVISLIKKNYLLERYFPWKKIAR